VEHVAKRRSGRKEIDFRNYPKSKIIMIFADFIPKKS
jgi:hypothetical protein